MSGIAVDKTRRRTRYPQHHPQKWVTSCGILPLDGVMHVCAIHRDLHSRPRFLGITPVILWTETNDRWTECEQLSPVHRGAFPSTAVSTLHPQAKSGPDLLKDQFSTVSTTPMTTTNHLPLRWFERLHRAVADDRTRLWTECGPVPGSHRRGCEFPPVQVPRSPVLA